MLEGIFVLFWIYLCAHHYGTLLDRVSCSCNRRD